MAAAESKPCKAATASLCFVQMGNGIDVAEPEHLVLYDGTCGFCHHTVQWIMSEDRDERFRFAPLQGPTAAAVRHRHPELPAESDSVVYVEGSGATERAYARSEAVFRIVERLPGAPAWMRLASHLPRWLTDLGYRVVVGNRQRISNALHACPLPSEAARARFLP